MFAATLAAGGHDWQRFRGRLRTPRTFLPPLRTQIGGVRGWLATARGR
jgi:hypothetical protein